MLKEFLKTPEQELQEVVDGKKPAALGNWNDLPSGVLSYELKPVYGRFYDMAIARNKENLNRAVSAYYMPISLDADVELGRALGYSEDDIIQYTKTQMYFKPLKKRTKQERTRLKILAEIQKIGICKVVDQVILILKGDKDSQHLLTKEDIDLEYAIEILLLMLKEKRL